MNRNKRTQSNSKNGKNYKERNRHYKQNKGKDDRENVNSARFDDEGRNNNPAYYFLDKGVAEQVSALSFQQLAGYNVNIIPYQMDMKVANICNVYMNPSPGVQLSSSYASGVLQKSAINLAGFRLFSKLSAYTGRAAVYGPQDVSTMILAFGELISTIEWVRRAFGVSYTMNMRNRDYPRKVLENMCIDADNFFANLANYRTEFNKIITRVNQLPIPKNVAYFDKCAQLYEHIYLDSPSSMAQTIMMHPATTWILDETSYSGGSILATQNWTMDKTNGAVFGASNLSYFLSVIDNMVDALMNSSTLQVVYTDLLNLASKQGVEFWKFDYLQSDYAVFPEYNLNFLLQFHNCTITGVPTSLNVLATGAKNITPYNDVYPNPANNALYYNPAFPNTEDTSGLRANEASVFPAAVIDMLNDNPTLEDRIEVTRMISTSDNAYYLAPNGDECYIDAVLPDHYVVTIGFGFTNGVGALWHRSIVFWSGAIFTDLLVALSQIDWSPALFFNDGSGYINERSIYELNYYTVVDSAYMRRLHDFVGLALYDLR